MYSCPKLENTDCKDYIPKKHSNAFKDKFIRLVIKSGMTDEECAILLGVSRSTIKRWARGETKPHKLIGQLILKILHFHQ